MNNHKKNPKLTDAERHKRFLDVAKKAEASDSVEDFNRAVVKIARPKTAIPQKSSSPNDA